MAQRSIKICTNVNQKQFYFYRRSNVLQERIRALLQVSKFTIYLLLKFILRIKTLKLRYITEVVTFF